MSIDDATYRWFAWRPVRLRSPRSHAAGKIVWLRSVWHMRTGGRDYYAASADGFSSSQKSGC